MPVLFNTNRDATGSQLDNLFLGNPNLTPDQVSSNLALSNPQGAGWVNQQAQNLGMGDPVAHYNAIRLAQTMAQTQSGAQANANQMAGNFSADSLPGQLARRNAMVDQASAANDQQNQQLASLQQQNNDRAYALPVEGGAVPQMTPVMRTAMAQQGITNPLQFLMQQRLGPNQGMVNTKPLARATQAINPDDLFNEPTFQAQLNRDPNKAASVFTALTGQDFGGYAKNYAASKQQERTTGTAWLRKQHEDGVAVLQPDGTTLWRQPVQNPTSGQMVPGPTLGPGNAFQKSMEQYLPYMDTKLAQFAQLHAKGGAAPSGPVVPPNPTETPTPLQAATFGGSMMGNAGNVAINTAAGAVNDIGNIFTGNPVGTGAAAAMSPVAGASPNHARAALANNPRFQALLRSNPNAARRIIMALQTGNSQDNSSIPVSSDSYSGSYPQ